MSQALTLGFGQTTLATSKGSGVTQDFLSTMPAGSTFSRVGAATALTADGLIVQVAADVPQRTNRGLAVEPAATNLFERAAPTVAQLALGLHASDAAEPASPPISGLNWLALDNTASLAVAYQPVTVTLSTAYALSVLVETPDGSQPVASTSSATGDFNFLCGGATDAASVFGYKRLSGNVWRVTAAVTSPLSPTTSNGILRHSTQDTRALKFAGFQLVVGAVAGSLILTVGSVLVRALPVFTEIVPIGCTKALLTYADATTTLVTGLTPGGTFDVATAVIGAGKGAFGVSELVSRRWQP